MNLKEQIIEVFLSGEDFDENDCADKIVAIVESHKTYWLRPIRELVNQYVVQCANEMKTGSLRVVDAKLEALMDILDNFKCPECGATMRFHGKCAGCFK